MKPPAGDHEELLRVLDKYQSQDGNKIIQEDPEPHESLQADVGILGTTSKPATALSGNDQKLMVCVKEENPESLLGTLWLRIWIYACLPLAILPGLVFGYYALKNQFASRAPSSRNDFLGLLLLILFIVLHASVAWGIHKRAKWAWWLNWIPVIGSYVFLSSLFMVAVKAGGGKASYYTYLVFSLMLILQFQYWRRRRKLFH